MGKSDEYIEYQAYMRYLGKVTCEPTDPDKLKRAVLKKAKERTEMQVALSLVKSLGAAAAIVSVCALAVAGVGYFTHVEDKDPDDEVWSGSRIEVSDRRGGLRLYEAYENSKEIRDKLL